MSLTGSDGGQGLGCAVALAKHSLNLVAAQLLPFWVGYPEKRGLDNLPTLSSISDLAGRGELHAGIGEEVGLRVGMGGRGVEGKMGRGKRRRKRRKRRNLV